MQINDVKSEKLKELLLSSMAFKLLAEDQKQNFLTKTADLDDDALAPILRILEEEAGEKKMAVDPENYDKIVEKIEILKKELEGLKGYFKNGILREEEKVDLQNDEKMAEKLLQSLKNL